jgi:voltage-gated potassium channel
MANGQPNGGSLRSTLRSLYFGHDPDAVRFQGVLVALDVAIVAFFILQKFIADQPWFFWLDYAIAAFLALDMGLKLYALGSLKRWLKYPTTWVDLIVLATFLFPQVLANFGFLRILRLWTLVHRDRTWIVLGGGRWDNTRVEDLTKAIVNLVVFVFLASGFAFAFFAGQHPKLVTFIDAMYFSVTALTTTGFGDITIDTQEGRIFKMILMVTGITLFFRIAQTAFTPPRRNIECTNCGLCEHEPAARYCRACGTKLPTGALSPRKRRHSEG